MDAATIKKMGKTAIINGSSYDVVPADQLEESPFQSFHRHSASSFEMDAGFSVEHVIAGNGQVLTVVVDAVVSAWLIIRR